MCPFPWRLAATLTVDVRRAGERPPRSAPLPPWHPFCRAPMPAASCNAVGFEPRPAGRSRLESGTPERCGRLGHPGPFDKTLLALGLLWLLCFGLSLHSAIAQVGYPSLILSAANEPDGYPSVVGLVPEAGTPEAGLALGDRLLRVGETDLRGRGHVALYEPFARAARAEGVIRVRYERAGVAREATLPVASYRIYWPRLPASLVFALAAALLTLRAPRSRMLRAFAQTFLVAACFLALHLRRRAGGQLLRNLGARGFRYARDPALPAGRVALPRR